MIPINARPPLEYHFLPRAEGDWDYYPIANWTSLGTRSYRVGAAARQIILSENSKIGWSVIWQSLVAFWGVVIVLALTARYLSVFMLIVAPVSLIAVPIVVGAFAETRLRLRMLELVRGAPEKAEKPTPEQIRAHMNRAGSPVNTWLARALFSVLSASAGFASYVEYPSDGPKMMAFSLLSAGSLILLVLSFCKRAMPAFPRTATANGKSGNPA
jgi:hypothetical protein